MCRRETAPENCSQDSLADALAAAEDKLAGAPAGLPETAGTGQAGAGAAPGAGPGAPERPGKGKGRKGKGGGLSDGRATSSSSRK